MPNFDNQNKIRNFAIIAHIDHGKSTLADRLLEFTGTVSKRDMKEQILDSMDLERERGITIKLTPVRMEYQLQAASFRLQASNKTQIQNSGIPHEITEDKYILNLIDTPGHIDFNYEVSRSLAACEGALLLVDATQGIQAQTLANLYLAVEQNLKIIPVINKIDLPAANVERVQTEIINLLGCKKEEIILASAKEGKGIKEIIETIIREVPPPTGKVDAPLRALIFDSVYDKYRGVTVYLRIVDGQIKKEDIIRLMSMHKEAEVLETGFFKPKFVPTDIIHSGEIGYAVLNLKEVSECKVGDTITSQKSIKSKVHKVESQTSNETWQDESVEALPGYKEVKPMVYAGIFPREGNDFEALRSAILKIKLSDAALFFEPENSRALGFGFRCGFLGLLHLEIFQERLRREFNLNVIVTVPSVAYRATLTDGKEIIVRGPQDLPEPTKINQIQEPIMKTDIVAPKEYIGGIMQLVSEKRGEYINTEYLDTNSVLLHYNVPLACLIVDFYDRLKSVSAGYASLNYELLKYAPAEVVKLDILVAEEKVEALSSIVYEDQTMAIGRKIVANLKETLPRQMFEVKIQAAIGAKIIASERISAFRKDVTAKLYGGDYTRKLKLLQKQKKGKKKMKAQGQGTVDIPAESFLAVLKR